MITMKEIDALREAWNRLKASASHCPSCLREMTPALGAAHVSIEAALRQWWKQGCREVEPDAKTWPDPIGPLNPRPRITGPSPADKLADAARAYVRTPEASRDMIRLLDALEAYASTCNGDPAASALFGSPPAPILVARYLLDALTGGALGSLICTVRDDLASWTSMTSGTAAMQATRSNLRANLKALGEKIDG